MSETELRRELDRTRRLLALVLDTGEMKAGIVGEELRHEWVSDAVAGPSDEEIRGKTDEDVLPPGIASHTSELKREAMETASRVEREFTSVDGSDQRRYRVAAEPRYDGDGRVDGALCAAADLTPQYRFLERTGDSVFTVDSDWTVTYWNGRIAERTGVPAEDIVGENLWDRYGDVIPPELAERYRRVMETGEPVEAEHFLSDPFGYWVEMRAFADDDGLSVYSREITERKEYEQRLESQRDTLDVLNEVLRHDIRNDLQMVTGYADLAEDHIDEEGKRHVETIRKRAEHAVELTRTAREISEVLFADMSDTGRERLRDHLTSEIEDLRSSGTAADVTVEGSVPDVRVVGDDMLGSVFRNLLKNAVLHNDKSVPEVTVTAEARDGRVVVRVADNGPGIPDSNKERVFGRGEKGLDSEGTGIGLYLVQTLVENYGGTVSVADNQPEGSVFSVTLPTVDSPGESAAETGADSDEAEQSGQ